MKGRATAFLFVSLTLASCGGNSSADSGAAELSGEKIYKKHCAICHGENGRKGFADAKILPESQLSLEERILLITNGRNTMMPYRGVLSEKEIEAVAKYTLTLD